MYKAQQVGRRVSKGERTCVLGVEFVSHFIVLPDLQTSKFCLILATPLLQHINE